MTDRTVLHPPFGQLADGLTRRYSRQHGFYYLNFLSREKGETPWDEYPIVHERRNWGMMARLICKGRIETDGFILNDSYSGNAVAHHGYDGLGMQDFTRKTSHNDI